ncbi:MAG: bifunctional tRNA (5-methylaminomethyl-2-thiouridine)(34)-methyltransferase MnmD/FAD-dependent 5-carboxymethylaminomethyl-2-thiouridine(34) oxidoreductase MnmC [Bdellovibrionales bacterium]|nr:bifunctional tRNA (5-methylaminomethyl-2-thiouridine)(34)-methyltransferase MnmD/FAD-dependent 5-carboxymethylaminomethyl-2-thiouridine(34) oxidoreductase MnmC [Bdellovibrionales bacterium]
MNSDIVWRGGDVPESTRFHDVYYSLDGGLAESRHVFILGNNLPQRWRDQELFVIGELGFGTGLNFCATINEWRKTGRGRLHYISFELFPLDESVIERSLNHWPEIAAEATALRERLPVPTPGFHRLHFDNCNASLTLVYGDARETLPQLSAQVDAWFLDGFAPAKNPELWGADVFGQIAELSRPGATAATFSAARTVKDNFSAAGFSFEKRPGFGFKRDMLCARIEKETGNKSLNPARTIVIGGGIAGTAAARSFAIRGSHVTLIESSAQIAEGASGNPTAIVMPHPTSNWTYRQELSDTAYQYSLRQAHNLDKSIIQDRTGALRLAVADSVANVLSNFDEVAYHPHHAIKLSAAEASDAAGTKCLRDALLFPSAGSVNPRTYCNSLLSAVSASSGVVVNTRAIEIQRTQDEWIVLDDSGNIVGAADAVIIANAFAASQFAQTRKLAIYSVRGQLAFVDQTPQSSQVRIPICHRGYILPAVGGTHVIGSTFDRDDLDESLRHSDHSELLKRTAEHLPELIFNNSKANGRTSFRAQTPDKLPLVGQLAVADHLKLAFSKSNPKLEPSAYPSDTRFPGLYISVGHGSHGISSAPLAAEQLACLAWGEPLPIGKRLVNALDPARQELKLLRRNN